MPSEQTCCGRFLEYWIPLEVGLTRCVPVFMSPFTPSLHEMMVFSVHKVISCTLEVRVSPLFSPSPPPSFFPFWFSFYCHDLTVFVFFSFVLGCHPLFWAASVSFFCENGLFFFEDKSCLLFPRSSVPNYSCPGTVLTFFSLFFFSWARRSLPSFFFRASG